MIYRPLLRCCAAAALLLMYTASPAEAVTHPVGGVGEQTRTICLLLVATMDVRRSGRCPPTGVGEVDSEPRAAAPRPFSPANNYASWQCAHQYRDPGYI